MDRVFARVGQVCCILFAVSALVGLIALCTFHITSCREREAAEVQAFQAEWELCIVDYKDANATLERLYKEGWEYHRPSGSDYILKRKRSAK